MRPYFIITIDTEGDDAWGWTYPRAVTTNNARHLPRFQALCERYGFKPTYLTNYEMTVDPTFQAFARSALERERAEIGLHVHVWNSPPLTNRPEWDQYQTYATEIPVEHLAPKMALLTRVLKETFGIPPVSHRGGRYGFNARVAQILEELGYRVDCSVTPGVSWSSYPGSPAGSGGPDYRDFPVRPYFVDSTDIRRAGSSSLLEVPVTIRPNYPEALYQWIDAWDVGRVAARVVNRLAGPPHSWLRPRGGNLPELKGVVDWACSEELPVLEFILHSSELMPGGSPTFRTEADIEALYQDLEGLFEHVSACGAVGATLAEYRWATGEPDARNG